MRKQVLSLLLLVFLLCACQQDGGAIAASSAREAQPDGPQAFLSAVAKEPTRYGFDEEGPYGYVLHDLDGDGIDECLFIKNMRFYIFSLKGTPEHVSDYNFATATARWYTSDDPDYPGLFISTVGGGQVHYGYFSLKGNEPKVQWLWNDNYATDGSTEILLQDEVLINAGKAAFVDTREVIFTPIQAN